MKIIIKLLNSFYTIVFILNIPFGQHLQEKLALNLYTLHYITGI
uniref:Uncharacterized protein n=1 Tax=Anguilla anguilla TaxID=7936 RepID=A0A0E9U4Y9_ANGAN